MDIIEENKETGTGAKQFKKRLLAKSYESDTNNGTERGRY